MEYQIMHATRQSIRVRFCRQRWTKTEAEALRRALSAVAGIEKVKVYPAAGGVYLEHTSREAALAALAAVDAETLAADPYADDGCITPEEWAARKLHPTLKRRMQGEILVEAAADLFLPAPAQFAFHAYQLLKLKD